MLQLAVKDIKINDTHFDDILKGWHTLAEPLSKADKLSWCYALYHYEKAHNNRAFILSRIKSRMIALGTQKIRRWVNELCGIKTNRKRNK